MDLLPALLLKPVKTAPVSNVLLKIRLDKEECAQREREEQREERLRHLERRLRKEQEQLPANEEELVIAHVAKHVEPASPVRFAEVDPTPVSVTQYSTWPFQAVQFDVLLSNVFLHGAHNSFVTIELHLMHNPALSSPSNATPSRNVPVSSGISATSSSPSWRIFIQQDFLPGKQGNITHLEGTSAKYEFWDYTNLANAQAAYMRLHQASSKRDGMREVRLVSATPGIGSLQAGDVPAVASPRAELEVFLDALFDESRQSLASVLNGTVTDDGLQTPLGVLSMSQVEQGEVLLVTALGNLVRGASTMQLAIEYNSLIPHKQPVNFDSSEVVYAELETCQLMKDLSTVTESKGVVVGSHRMEKRLQALGCQLVPLSPSHPEYAAADEFVRRCPSVTVSRIVKVNRAADANFRRDIANIRLLCHGSSASNFVGILSRGLLLPTLAVSRYGQRRSDEGLLGAGVYFADDLGVSLKFCQPSQHGQGSRYVALCSVALGKCKSFAYADSSLTGPPEGFQSVQGVPGSGVFAAVEYVVYDTDQIRIDYIVEFSLGSEAKVPRSLPIPSLSQTSPQFEVVKTFPTTLAAPSTAAVKSDLPLPPVGLVVEGGAVPLVATYIRGRLVDLVAEVVLLQKYHNTSSSQVEAKYVFPLDPLCAVCGFEAFINGKHVIGEVKEKEVARQEYAEAVARGDGAYLMEEETADVFSVTIGNLPPKAEVLVKITYVTELAVSMAATVFRVPGALVPAGQLLDVSLALDMPYDIVRLETLFHNVRVRRTKAKATIVYEGESSGKDFVLHVTTESPHEPRMWVEQNEKSTACMLVFYPNFAAPAACPALPELVVVLDCSQSMASAFSDAQAAAQCILTNLPVGKCRFNLICFGSHEERMWPFSVECNSKHLQIAMGRVRAAQANMGGTLLWPVLRRVFVLDDERGPSRSVMVVTDSRVAQPKAITSLATAHASQTRLFMIGVGGEVDEHTTAAVARSGGGLGTVLSSPFGQHPIANRNAITQQIHRAFQPAVTNASVTWIGLNGDSLSSEQEILQAPTCISSVFSGERCVVFGFANSCFSAALKGYEAGKEWGGRVDCAQACVRTGTLVHRLAAKCVIRNYEEGIYDPGDHLTDDLARKHRQDLVLKLGLQYSLVTEFTSFVAVEDRSKESEETGPSLEELVERESVDCLPYIELEDLLCTDLVARKEAVPKVAQNLPEEARLAWKEVITGVESRGSADTTSVVAVPTKNISLHSSDLVASTISSFNKDCGIKASSSSTFSSVSTSPFAFDSSYVSGESSLKLCNVGASTFDVATPNVFNYGSLDHASLTTSTAALSKSDQTFGVSTSFGAPNGSTFFGSSGDEKTGAFNNGVQTFGSSIFGAPAPLNFGSSTTSTFGDVSSAAASAFSSTSSIFGPSVSCGFGSSNTPSFGSGGFGAGCFGSSNAPSGGIGAFNFGNSSFGASAFGISASSTSTSSFGGSCSFSAPTVNAFGSNTYSGPTGFASSTLSASARDGFGGAIGALPSSVGTSSFGTTTFGGTSSFGTATFGGTSSFGTATFGGASSFGAATFGGTSSFGAATFGGTSSFGTTTFGGTFGTATFGGTSSFGTTSFGGASSFGTATFGGTSSFGTTTFGSFSAPNTNASSTLSASSTLPASTKGGFGGSPASSSCSFAAPDTNASSTFSASTKGGFGGGSASFGSAGNQSCGFSSSFVVNHPSSGSTSFMFGAPPSMPMPTPIDWGGSKTKNQFARGDNPKLKSRSNVVTQTHGPVTSNQTLKAPSATLPSVVPAPALVNGVTRATGNGKPSGGGVWLPQRYLTASSSLPKGTARDGPVLTPFGVEAFVVPSSSTSRQDRSRTGQAVFELGFLGPRYFESNCWLSGVVALVCTVLPLRLAALQCVGDGDAGSLLTCYGAVVDKWINGHRMLLSTKHTAVFRKELKEAMDALRNAFMEHAGLALLTDHSAVAALRCLLLSFSSTVSPALVGAVNYTPYSRAMAKGIEQAGRPQFLIVFNPRCCPIIDQVIADYEIHSFLANVDGWYANGDQTTHCVCFAFARTESKKIPSEKVPRLCSGGREMFVFDDLMEVFGCQGGLVASCSVEALLGESLRIPILIYSKIV